MADANSIRAVGGYEALAVAVVVQARKDSKKDERARSWLIYTGPWLLSLVFDIDEGVIRETIAETLPPVVAPLPQPRKQAA